MFILSELIEIVITILFAGYILQPLSRGNLKQSFVFAGLSIVLHELGHKFTALAFGFNAVYHANYSGLIFGLMLRVIGLPVFFVPAYVSINGSGSWIGYFLTALAGPLTNLILFGIATLLLTQYNHKEWVQDNAEFINALRVINLWLAIFNALPIPGTDGFNALMSIKRIL